MEAAKAQISNTITLTHFIMNEGRAHPERTGQFALLLHALEIAAKYTSSKVREAGLADLLGVAGQENASGDTVKRLDVVANTAFVTSIKRSGVVRCMVSEEDEEPILVENAYGHYMCAFDPLDGSSNIDANVSIGTIFGVWRTSEDATLDNNLALRSGREQVASGYIAYGSATVFVLSTGPGRVNAFTLESQSGEFVLSHPNIQIRPHRKIYSVNGGNRKHWYKPTSTYFDRVESEGYSQRYVGSMVADVHRTLLYGGIFSYPAQKNAKNGKLRLLYEVFPMAKIIEDAGGLASTGTSRALDIKVTDIHQRSGIYLGSKEMVEELEACFPEGWTVESDE